MPRIIMDSDSGINFAVEYEIEDGEVINMDPSIDWVDLAISDAWVDKVSYTRHEIEFYAKRMEGHAVELCLEDHQYRVADMMEERAASRYEDQLYERGLK